MLKKTVPTLIAVALTFGIVQLAHAQKNYTDGADIYSGNAHTKNSETQSSAARQGKFDPYTEGAKKSAGANLTSSGTPAKSGKFDPYTDGAKTGKFDPYTEGAKSDKPEE